MKKTTKTAPKKTNKPLNVFKLKAGSMKMIHGGQGTIIPGGGFPGGGGGSMG